MVANTTGSESGRGRSPAATGAELAARHAIEAFSQVIGGGEAKMADLVHGLDPHRTGRTASHAERPDRFDVPGPGLGQPAGPATLRGPGGFDRVDRIGLAGLTSTLPIRLIDLDHRDAPASERPVERRPIRTGAFDTDQVQPAERVEPTDQRVVAVIGRGERLDAEEPADLIERRSDVDVQMCVDPAGDPAVDFYDGHAIPFIG